MDITQYVLLGAVLVGVNQLIRLLRAKDFWGAVTVIAAALIGALFGLFGVEGLDVVHGMALAFGTVGTLTGGAAILGHNTVTPNSTAAVK